VSLTWKSLQAIVLLGTFVTQNFLNNFNNMKQLVLTIALLLAAFVGYAQCKMDSDKKTLRNSSNSSIGRIDSDGVTIRNSSNSSVGRVDSDGVTIRNSSNSMVLRIDGSTIRNSSNSSIATLSDVSRALGVSNPTAAHVALWWFLCKN
jgi:hypothetical protein